MNKKYENELMIIENMPLGYVEHEMIYNEKGVAINYKYIKVNDMFCRLTGWKREDIENKLVTDVFPNVDNERIQLYQELFEKDSSIEFKSYFEKQKSWYKLTSFRSSSNKFITLFSDITDMIETNEKLEYMLYHNEYSKMFNYRGFKKHTNNLKNIEKCYCFVITIKNSSSIFSFYGENFVNELYKNYIKKFNKYKDNGHIVGHSSYNQILLLMINPTDKEFKDALIHAKQSLNVNYKFDNYDVVINESIGYASCDGQQDIDELIKRASIANIYASQSQLSSIIKYTDDLGVKINEDIEFTKNLTKAIYNDEIKIYFQKIIDSKSGDVKYYEALTRWYSKDYGFVSPEKIFSNALKSGMIETLDEYIIDKTFRVYSKFKQDFKLDENIKLCINLSSTALYKNNVEKMILSKTSKHNLVPTEICLEISEHTFVNDLNICIDKINVLRNHGYLIAIDDFGSKYSTIGILDKIPYDVLKLDGLFAKKINTFTMQVFVETINKIAKHLNKIIIVERIETKEEADLFNSLSCTIHQGYLYHQPENYIKEQ